MEMSATQKVGQEIKKVRYRMGMTQKELGKLIGKSESQIGAYENASATRRYRNMIDSYLKDGKTPELTIQGVQTDKNSDFYATNKSETVTCVGCVPTDDINLIDMDTDGDVVKESIKFGAKRLA